MKIYGLKPHGLELYMLKLKGLKLKEFPIAFVSPLVGLVECMNGTACAFPPASVSQLLTELLNQWILSDQTRDAMKSASSEINDREFYNELPCIF